MSICCACRKRKNSGSTVIFHVFPQDRSQSEKWCKAVGLVGPPTKSSRVCSEHFTEQDYTKGCDGVSKGKLLLPTAVPTQNLESQTEAPDVKVPRMSSIISSKIQELEEILQRNADPQSIEFSHDPDAHTITVRYQSNPVPKPAESRAKRVCSRCKAILQAVDFETHAKSCVGGKLKPFQCATCQACYETIKELRLHKCNPLKPDDHSERREQLELLTKAITGREYDSDSDAVDVGGEKEEEVQPNKQCNECDRLIPVSRMRLHYRKVHKDCGKAPFRCRLCESQFELCGDLSKHLKSHTAKQLRSLRNRKPDGIPFDGDGTTCYECYLCGNVFGSVESIRLHQGSHLGDNVRCPVCGRIFEQKFDFLKHLASH